MVLCLCAKKTRASLCKGVNRCAAACTGLQGPSGKMSQDRTADLFRIPDIVGLDAADGGKGNRANAADANGGKSPPFGGSQRQGYFIDQAGTQPCRINLYSRSGFTLKHYQSLYFRLWFARVLS